MKLTHTSIIALGLAVAPLSVAAESHSGNSMTGTVGSSETAQAGEPGALCANSFSVVDANEDGMVSEEDARRSSFGQFQAIDVDESGSLTRDEYVACMTSTAGTEAAPMERTPADLDALDDDGDGEVQFDEWVNVASGAYAEVTGDTPPQELQRTVQQLTYTREDGEVAPRIGEMTDAEYWRRVARVFSMFDSDQSGSVSSDEWRAEAVEQIDLTETYDTAFTEMDTNEDGMVSEEEFTARNMATYEDAIENIPGQEDTANAEGLPGIPVVFYRFYVTM